MFVNTSCDEKSRNLFPSKSQKYEPLPVCTGKGEIRPWADQE
jgi:hypothetical protein